MTRSSVQSAREHLKTMTATPTATLTAAVKLEPKRKMTKSNVNKKRFTLPLVCQSSLSLSLSLALSFARYRFAHAAQWPIIAAKLYYYWMSFSTHAVQVPLYVCVWELVTRFVFAARVFLWLLIILCVCRECQTNSTLTVHKAPKWSWKTREGDGRGCPLGRREWQA